MPNITINGIGQGAFLTPVLDNGEVKSIEVIEPGFETYDEISIGVFQSLSLMSIISIIEPLEIHTSPWSSSSIILQISAFSIDGLLTTTNCPSGMSPTTLPIVPEESETIAVELEGDLEDSEVQEPRKVPEPNNPIDES